MMLALYFVAPMFFLLVMFIVLFGFSGVGSLLGVKIKWSTDKVTNLLLYKIVTKEKFTPTEQDMMNDYFGHQHKELIRDSGKVKKYKRFILTLDVLAVLLTICTALAIFLGTSPLSLGV